MRDRRARGWRNSVIRPRHRAGPRSPVSGEASGLRSTPGRLHLSGSASQSERRPDGNQSQPEERAIARGGRRGMTKYCCRAAPRLLVKTTPPLGLHDHHPERCVELGHGAGRRRRPRRHGGARHLPHGFLHLCASRRGGPGGRDHGDCDDVDCRRLGVSRSDFLRWNRRRRRHSLKTRPRRRSGAGLFAAVVHVHAQQGVDAGLSMRALSSASANPQAASRWRFWRHRAVIVFCKA